LFTAFANPSEVSYGEAETNLLLKLIDLQCNCELKLKYKGDMLNIYKCLLKDRYPT